MDAIANNLKDPSWWFSAFFIAIIASVIASFLKERIEKLLSKTFSSLTSWRARKELERANLIESLLADQMYFHIALFRTVVALILFALASIMYFSAPVLLATLPDQSSHLLEIDRKFFIWKVFTPILGFFNIIVAYRATRRISVVSQAIREYRKRKALPRLF